MKVKVSTDESFVVNAVFSGERRKRYLYHQRLLEHNDPTVWQSISFPLEISLELTNYCNLRCVMCPNPSLERERGYMLEDVFKGIVRGLSEEKGFFFLPQGFGEPLLHRQFFDLICLAFDSGIKPIAVLSNGHLLNGPNLDGIIKTASVVIVTIDGVTPQTYESVRLGGTLEAVRENVEQFLLKRGHRRQPHLVLRIIDMKETASEIGDFLEFWRARISETDVIQVANYNDWAGTVESHENPIRHRGGRHPCRMLWKNLSVFHNGLVTPCCYDAEGQLLVGDAREESLRDIWEGGRLDKIRAIHLGGRYELLPLCYRCKGWL